VRLGEHRELRQTLELMTVSDFTTLYRFLQRLKDLAVDRAVGETVGRLRGGKRRSRKRIAVGVDATGLAQGALSTFFCAADAPSWAKTAALAALLEVVRASNTFKKRSQKIRPTLSLTLAWPMAIRPLGPYLLFRRKRLSRERRRRRMRIRMAWMSSKELGGVRNSGRSVNDEARRNYRVA
jgi:hypothetical protein